MQIFNRIFVILAAVCASAGAALVLMVTAGAAQPEQIAPWGWAQQQLSQLRSLEPRTLRLTAGIGAAVMLAGLILLVWEVMPGDERRTVTIQEDASGRVTVTQAGVRDLVAYEARSVPGVMEVRPSIRQDHLGLRVRCRVLVQPRSSLADVGRELSSRIRALLERSLRLPVTELRVDARMAHVRPPRVL